MRLRAAVAAGVGAAGCGPPEPRCDADVFVAMQADFASFERWHRFEIDPPDPRLGTGARAVYASDLPARGGDAFPLCTRIVKVGENGPDPIGWLMVGMAKRGGGYNADGAVDWEWFDLELSADGAPLIDWRGPVPPEGRGYECALGEDEVGVEGLGDCNFCHAGAADHDYVLTPAIWAR